MNKLITRNAETLCNYKLYTRVISEIGCYGYVRCTVDELVETLDYLNSLGWDTYNCQWFDVNGDYVPQLNREPSENYTYDVGIEEWIGGSTIIVIREVEV